MGAMRTLGDILDAVADGSECSDQELRLALLAMKSLWTFQCMDIRNMAHRGSPLDDPKRVHEESFKRNKQALSVSPKHWLGDSVPSNPEWQRQRRVSLKLFDMALKGELPNQKGETGGD